MPFSAFGLAILSAFVHALWNLLLARARDIVPAVQSLRETSVLIAVAAGAIFLGESVGRLRAAGALLVVAGVAALAVA